MAAISNFGCSSVLRNFPGLTTVPVRFASKGNKPCRQDNQRGQHRGIKKWPGKTVPAGAVLVTQNKMRFHPGLNVGIGRNLTIYALSPGKVVISMEKVNPRWDNKSFSASFYANRDTSNLYKKFFNILPEPQPNVFKLVDLM